MRICLVCSSFLVGGSSRVVCDLAASFKDRGNDVIVVSLWNDYEEQYKKFLTHKKIEFLSCDKKNKFDFLCYKKLKRIFKKFKPDIIHTHLTSLFYVWLARPEVQIYHTIHCDPVVDIPGAYRKLMNKWIKNGRIKLIGCSESIAKQSAEIYKSKVVAITNGVKTDNNYSNEEKIYDFLFVGRFVSLKNIPQIIDAFEIIRSKKSDLKLCICGDGEEKEKIVEYIKTKELNSSIDMIVNCENMDEVYKKSKVLCLFSSTEGGPMVLLEAFSRGIPALCSDIPGCKNFAQNYYNSMLFELNNVNEAATLGYEMLNNQELYNHLSENAFKTAKEFSIEKTSNEYLSLFSEAIAK